MNELKIVSYADTVDTSQTPIEVLLQVGEDGRASSRDVFDFLGMNPANYARWCRNNIEKNEFAEDGVDFIRSSLMMNGNETLDYRLSVPFAKKLCMISKTERGEQARDYFVAVEKTLQRVAQKLPQLTTNEMLLQMAQSNVEMERRVLLLEESQAAVVEKFDTALKTFAAPSIDTWKADMDTKINDMVETYKRSPTGFRGMLYKELEQTATVDLKRRKTFMQNRMKKQGATYKERQAVTKLDVISKDKQLRAIFESIVKKYQAIFGAEVEK